jgi:hypothetical protein
VCVSEEERVCHMGQHMGVCLKDRLQEQLVCLSVQGRLCIVGEHMGVYLQGNLL